jgi:hypothetical protein
MLAIYANFYTSDSSKKCFERFEQIQLGLKKSSSQVKIRQPYLKFSFYLSSSTLKTQVILVVVFFLNK